jgi:hypothetical protein
MVSAPVVVAWLGWRGPAAVSISAAFAPILLPHQLELNVGVGIAVTFLRAIRAVRLRRREMLRLSLARGLRQSRRSGNDDRCRENEYDLHPAPPAPTGGATRARELTQSRMGTAQLHFKVMATSPGMPPGKSTISTLSLYPRSRKYFAQS